MATPNAVVAPYGFRPINLIGGHPFAGSTRMIPIQYSYATSIFYGDFVKNIRGFCTRRTVAADTGVDYITGVFLGCSYTDPTTKQKHYSQYWPASTLAGDGMAYVCDDPNAIFKAAVCSATTTMASANLALVGLNASAVDNTGSTATGNSANAILAASDTPAITQLPLRMVGVVEDTAIVTRATGSSSSTTITLTGAGALIALPVGTNVAYLASNGQVVQTSSFVDTAAAAGDTSVTLNQTVAVPGSVTAIPSAATIIFTIYREALVKVNAFSHSYTNGVTVAT